MDHSMHSSMDMDMPGHEHMGNSCKMSMLLTWEYEDYCILTKSWHIKNKQDLILSILFTIMLGLAYEFYKKVTDDYLRKLKPAKLITDSSNVGSSYSRGASVYSRNLHKYKTANAVFYGIRIFLSFLLMLVFMSFNYWIMISLCIGAALGAFLFDQPELENDSLACH